MVAFGEVCSSVLGRGVRSVRAGGAVGTVGACAVVHGEVGSVDGAVGGSAVASGEASGSLLDGGGSGVGGDGAVGGVAIVVDAVGVRTMAHGEASDSPVE